jgi:hypothetical protein
LPAWEVDEMPEPKPFRWKHMLALIGPGLVLAGGSIGTGEWVMGPQAAAKYHGAMMWAVLLSILAQVVLNTEVMRYTLCTGEPIMTGFLRCKPGPKFWLGFYLVLDFGSLLPSLAGLAAQIIVVLVQKLGPNDVVDTNAVRIWSYAIFTFCAILVLFGGKVYNIVGAVVSGKFLFLLFYMLLCCLFFVSMSTWGDIWGGLIDPTRFPRNSAGNAEIDWGLISALAGFAGVGGMGNIMVSNFVREKGWGMGGKVGAIPSAFGGHHITLSHIGTICPDTPETKRRFQGWFKYLLADQYLVWAFGSLVGMMLPCMLGAEYLRTQSLQGTDQWRWAAALAQDFGAARGQIFFWLTMFCGLIILIPGQFYVVDNVARRWTDAVWSGSAWARKLENRHIKRVYYFFAAAYVFWGIMFFTAFPQLSGSDMMKIAGNLANFTIAATIFQTIYVNRRFLPAGVRPSRAKELAMVLAGLFFVVMFGLVVNQKILPLLKHFFEQMLK